MNSSTPGRKPVLDAPQQAELLQHLAAGATLEEASARLGVSVRTVQRLAQADELFDDRLRLALLSAPVNPLKLMEAAARTHWRAAAWLLERTDPERFGKRPPHSCSPVQLQAAIATLIEAALEVASPEGRQAVYEHLQAAAQKTFDDLFPHRDPYRRCPSVMEPVTEPVAPARAPNPPADALPGSAPSPSPAPNDPSSITDAECDDILRRTFRRYKKEKNRGKSRQRNIVAKNALHDKINLGLPLPSPLDSNPLAQLLFPGAPQNPIG